MRSHPQLGSISISSAPYQSREWPRLSLHLPDREVLNYFTRTEW
ncbi:hypothetical protein [Moorena bouillonii]|nr:hypothetical protein [Moorena bouillonii]